MKLQDDSIPIIYCRIILASVCRTAAELQAILEGTGLTLDCMKELDAGISTQGYRQLIRNAKAISGDDAIMLVTGHKVPITAHGALGHAAIYSPNLYAVFKLCEQFSKLRAHFATLTVEENGAETNMYFDIAPELGDEKDAALDFMLAGMATSRFALKFSPVNPLRTLLRRDKPKDFQRYRELLACDVRYGQESDCLIFSTADLLAPLPAHDPKEYSAAIEKCQQLFQQSYTPATMKEAVEQIFERNPGLICSIESVAENFNMSSRTLQRRLRQEDTHFQHMLDEWLKNMALRYLLQERLSTEVTATMLGYSDEANFRRAFKRWFGIPPSVYVQQCGRDENTLPNSTAT